MPQGGASTRQEPDPSAHDGILYLPPGKIAAIATYLEMRTAPPTEDGLRSVAPDGCFETLAGDLARYRHLYKSVGEPWLWFSRARVADAQLGAILRDADVEALALRRGAQDIGMIELDFRRAGECELCFLGLVPEAIGQGDGDVLIAEAIRRAFLRPITRLWLHTCTLDHHRAVGFYMRAGFVPFRRAVEIADDPRLTGELSRDAAPAVPVV